VFTRSVFFVFLLFVGFLAAQDGLPGMVGNTDDFDLIAPQSKQPNEFTFARLIYNSKVLRYSKSWYTDYPNGDRTIIEITRRLTNIDVAQEERAIPIHHPDLFNYPMIFVSEPEQMVLDERDVLRLQEYFARGGFLMMDDFWGELEWNSVKENLEKIFPGIEIKDIPTEHSIFHTVFDIANIMRVPNVLYVGCPGCPQWENDGEIPYVRGIFDGNGRLMVVIYFNTDTMDAAEWADEPRYSQHFSTYAYKIFINTIVYAMTH